MPDWRAIVEARLAGLRWPPARRAQIVQELSEHLADEFARLAQTRSTHEAARITQARLDDPAVLQEAMQAVDCEDEMNERTRGLWIPGLVSLTLSGLLLTAFGRWGPRPTFIFLESRLPLILYPFWLVSLPLFGALGAWLAKRAGATRNERLLAGVFPIMTMVAAFFLILPIAMIVDGSRIPEGQLWKGFALATVNWVLLPGVPLLLGALPFLRNGSAAKLEEAR